jgi:hypothetical protein
MSGVVKDVEADSVVNAPVEAVVAPMVVPLMVPPVMVAPELDSALNVAVEEAVRVVKAPVDWVVAPIEVLLIVPPVIVADGIAVVPVKVALLIGALLFNCVWMPEVTPEEKFNSVVVAVIPAAERMLGPDTFPMSARAASIPPAVTPSWT